MTLELAILKEIFLKCINYNDEKWIRCCFFDDQVKMKKLLLFGLVLFMFVCPLLFPQSVSDEITTQKNYSDIREVLIHQTQEKIYTDFNSKTGFLGQSDLGLMGVGLRIGFLDIGGGAGSTIAFGGLFDLGVIVPNLSLEADVLYWSKSYRSDYQPDSKSDMKVHSMSISAVVKYFFFSEFGQLHPYAGAGLGLTFYRESSDTIDRLTRTRSTVYDTALDIHVAGGVKIALSSKITGFGEFRYNIEGYTDYWGVFTGVVYQLK